MTEHHFLVSKQGSHWKVSYRGTDQGPYSSVEEAVEVAVSEARKAGQEGFQTEVLVQDDTLQFRRHWKYGDPSGQDASTAQAG
jgi:hypothetical protein